MALHAFHLDKLMRSKMISSFRTISMRKKGRELTLKGFQTL
jgi:hypothetical protein